MLGYDWPRLHAALNDLPAALLLVAVLFDLAGAATQRPALRTAGFWTLIAGAVGGALAVISGLQAEGAEGDEKANGPEGSSSRSNPPKSPAGPSPSRPASSSRVGDCS